MKIFTSGTADVKYEIENARDITDEKDHYNGVVIAVAFRRRNSGHAFKRQCEDHFSNITGLETQH